MLALIRYRLTKYKAQGNQMDLINSNRQEGKKHNMGLCRPSVFLGLLTFMATLLIVLSV